MKIEVKVPVSQIAMFIVTGIDATGKRFKIETSHYAYACCINLHKGSVWAMMDNGKRVLLKRVF